MHSSLQWIPSISSVPLIVWHMTWHYDSRSFWQCLFWKSTTSESGRFFIHCKVNFLFNFSSILSWHHRSLKRLPLTRVTGKKPLTSRKSICGNVFFSLRTTTKVLFANKLIAWSFKSCSCTCHFSLFYRIFFFKVARFHVFMRIFVCMICFC